MLKNRPIVISHIINSLEIGGAEKVLINIVNNENYHKVKILVYSLSNNNPLKSELNKKIYFKNYKKFPVFDFFLVCKLIKEFRKKHIEIVHIHSWGIFPEVFLAAFFAKIPYKILMDHGRVNIDGQLLNKKNVIYNFFKNKILSIFINNTNAFIAVSNDIKIKISKEMNISPNKIFVVHNGISIPSNKKDTIEPNSKLFNLISAENDCYNICCVGRLVKIKNYSTLIEAFSLLRGNTHKTKLFIVGDGPDRIILETLIQKLDLADSVFLTGFTNDVQSILIRCNLFVIPSYYEGISISLLEAMANGLPVIASDVGGNKEIIEHRTNGFLFNPYNKFELYKYMLEIIDNIELNRFFSQNNKTKIINNFSIDIALKKYHMIYESCREVAPKN